MKNPQSQSSVELGNELVGTVAGIQHDPSSPPRQPAILSSSSPKHIQTFGWGPKAPAPGETGLGHFQREGQQHHSVRHERGAALNSRE